MSQRPFGNDFLVSTPALDQLHNQLYQDERQRDMMRQKEMSSLDDLVLKEVGKIRSADTDEFIGQYEKYKNLKKQLLSTKTTPKNQSEYNKLNQQANIEYAKAMQLANESAELKDRFKLTASQRAKDPNSFKDDFLDRYSVAMSTPLSRLKAHSVYGDLTNPNTFAYEGGNTDFSKDLKIAGGVNLRDVTPFEVEQDPEDKFKRIVKSYKVKNDPYTFYNNLVGGLYGSKRTRDFPLQYKYTPEQEASIEAQFNEMAKDPKFSKIYGIKDGTQFPSSAYTTELGRAARLKAMEFALDAANQPVEKITRITNDELKIKDAQDFKTKYAAIQNAYIRGRQKISQDSPGLEQYDILGYQSKDAEEVVTKVKVGGTVFNPIYEEKVEYRVPANKIDGNLKKYLGGKSPKSDDKGNRYYVVLEDGNWEGANGEILDRGVIAETYKSTKVPMKERDGLPSIRTPKDINNLKIQPKFQGVPKGGF